MSNLGSALNLLLKQMIQVHIDRDHMERAIAVVTAVNGPPNYRCDVRFFCDSIDTKNIPYPTDMILLVNDTVTVDRLAVGVYQVVSRAAAAGPGSGTGGSGGPDTSTENAHYQRQVIEIPYDSSTDATHTIDCFWQMPTGTKKIKKVQLWVKRKSFRQYSLGASSDGGHIHGQSTGSYLTSHGSTGGNSGSTDGNSGSTDSGAAHTTDAQGVHNHGTDAVSDPSFNTHDHSNAANTNLAFGTTHTHVTTDAGSHSHNVNGHTHGLNAHTHGLNGHTHGGPGDHGIHYHTGAQTDGTHTHGSVPGIQDQGSLGTLQVYISSAGIYPGGSAGPYFNSAADAVALDLTAAYIALAGLTAGDRWVILYSTTLMRLQAFLVVDLVIEMGATTLP